MLWGAHPGGLCDWPVNDVRRGGKESQRHSVWVLGTYSGLDDQIGMITSHIRRGKLVLSLEIFFM